MKVVIDMNLSPEWVEVLRDAGFEAVHWSSIGDKTAKDSTILTWARHRGWLIFTNDLDFSRLLALTYATGPSVLQIRGRELLPESMSEAVVSALTQYEEILRTGALAVIDGDSLRVRILPIKQAE